MATRTPKKVLVKSTKKTVTKVVKEITEVVVRMTLDEARIVTSLLGASCGKSGYDLYNSLEQSSPELEDIPQLDWADMQETDAILAAWEADDE